MEATVGIVAVIIQIGASVPYILDILRHKTKPERAGFWIFLLLTIITLAAQISHGFSWASGLLIAAGCTQLVIALLSIKYGYGRLKPRDFISVILAILGVLGWLITDQPLITVGIVIAIDFAGFWLILAKTWEAPQTETLITWLLCGMAAGMVLATARSFDLVQIGYIAYSAVANLGIVMLIIYRRKVLQYKLPKLVQ